MGNRLSDLSGGRLFQAVRKAIREIETARQSRLFASALLRGHDDAASRAIKLYADGLLTYQEYRALGGDLAHRERAACVNRAFWYVYHDTEDPRVATFLPVRAVDAALCILDAPIPAPGFHDIANVIYTDEDWEGMPIFADMLDDAGLPIHAAHCRTPFHARGCWVLESLRCG